MRSGIYQNGWQWGRGLALAVSLAALLSASGCLVAAAGAGAAGGYVVGHEQGEHDKPGNNP